MHRQTSAQDENTSLHHTHLDSATAPAASTDGTKEPLLQHLFEDLEQRRADPALPTSEETHGCGMTTSSSNVNGEL